MANNNKTILFVIDADLLEAVDAAIETSGETNRSRFIRDALRNKLARLTTLPRPEDGQVIPVVEVEIEK